MKRFVGSMLVGSAVVAGLFVTATPASAGCWDNPPPPPPAAEFIKYEGGDLVAVCQGYDNCEALIAICLP